ncbi:Holliday junction resolvase RuvX [Candidatus Gracilibacteria bacterium]|nr:Holliday junction resolvase RuvX [Candidatus Gracilibacteria bacterium]
MKNSTTKFESRVASHGPFISIDYGTRKSGLAYSVESFCFAHTTVPTKELIGYLTKWEKQKSCEGIIIGLPLNIDGTESKHSSKVRKFAKEIETLFPSKKIVLHDERLTTSEARLSGAEDIDAESARLILSDYLENNE